MKQMIRFGLILGAICLIATLVLAAVHEVTKPKIEEQMRIEKESAMKEVSPGADTFKEATADDIEYYEAYKGGELTGYCLKLMARGYGGYIHMIAGIDKNGVITGVRILEHQETPGLGSKMNEIKPGEKDPWFLRQFVGKPAASVEVKKNIDAITGATISTRAVTDAVREGADKLLEKLKK